MQHIVPWANHTAQIYLTLSKFIQKDVIKQIMDIWLQELYVNRSHGNVCDWCGKKRCHSWCNIHPLNLCKDLHCWRVVCEKCKQKYNVLSRGWGYFEARCIQHAMVWTSY